MTTVLSLVTYRAQVVHFKKVTTNNMLKKKIRMFLVRTHFWRDAGFDELSELYVSNLLRSLALAIFAIFVPYFLYQNGYSGAAIFSTFGLFFVFRAPMDIVAGYFVARFGPKHAMIISCALQIMNALVLLTLPTFNWHPVIIALPWGISASFFFVAYHVAFSKVKHTLKAGHELGHMQTFERAGYLIGPLVGGIVGTVFGPQYIFLAATLLLITSLWPLLLTAEPVKTQQKISFKTLDASKIKSDLFAYACLTVENTLCINTWPLYISVFVLSGAVYAQLGALSTFGVIAAILSAKLIGRVTDTSVARKMLRLSAIINASLYVFRPFVNGLWGIFAINIANDAINAGYRMPFIKGMYAAADDLPGYRIVYISSMESVASIAKGTIWFCLAILAATFSLQVVLWISFAVAAIASLGIMSERFKVYNLK